MNISQKRSLLLGVVAFALLMYAVTHAEHKEVPPPSAGGYYSGPMLRKGNIWVTGDGKIVPPPAGWKPSPTFSANPGRGSLQ